MLGVRPVTERGRRFAVIAARSNPRWWLVPLDNRRATVAGLQMLQPVTLSARLSKAGGMAIARFGPHTLLSRDLLRLSGLPDLSEAFSGRAEHVAYFTGTDGPHRKSALQVMDSEGAILGYAKLSRMPHVRPYLYNEKVMLAHVAAMKLRSADVPRVLAFRDDGTVTLLVTDSLKSVTHTSPKFLVPEHIAFLAELRRHTEHRGADELLDKILVQTRANYAAILGPVWANRLVRLEAILRPYANTIPLCLGHGDFTPWNTFMQSGRLYVFDWEYARPDWPVGYDLAHFLLSTLPASDQPDQLPNLIRTLADTQFGGVTTYAVRALLLSLACHALFYINRLREAGSPLEDWIDGSARAVLIDRIINQEITL